MGQLINRLKWGSFLVQFSSLAIEIEKKRKTFLQIQNLSLPSPSKKLVYG
jgi:hypothetical protein